MRPIITSATILAAFAMLSACSDKEDAANSTPAESNAVTQTRMDDIDSLEGTISDEMIITDDATEEGALASADNDKKSADKPAKAKNGQAGGE